ncbi:flagellar hook-length control protein FliK [Amphritea atlantica]|uniref:Flagellar hook-length control protein FliK n=1 Tax=Amphritea atlantica TaxID=355243 RepID=A0ABY5GS34_9GAMM|nr:flagellar hook-length control protein FliK [Amphritea atlantica]
MNQTLSAPNGVGSLLNVGSAPVRGAMSGVSPGTGAAVGGTPSFGESLLQAQPLSGSGEQSDGEPGRSGQTLPDSGQLLPAGMENGPGAVDVAERPGVQVVVDVVTKAGAETADRIAQRGQEQALEQQSQQSFKPPPPGLSDSNIDALHTSGKSGADTLNQIDRYRRADLAVAVDSALKQLGSFSTRGGSEKGGGSAWDRSLSEGVTSADSVAAVATEPQGVSFTQAVQAGAQAPSAVVSELAARETLTSQLTPSGVAPHHTGAGEAMRAEVGPADVRPLPGKGTEISRIAADVLGQGGESEVSVRDVNELSAPDSQSAGSAALADDRDAALIKPVPAGVVQAGGLQAVPAAMVGEFAAESAPMVQASGQRIDRSGNSALSSREDKGVISPADGPLPRPLSQDQNSQQSGRQHNELLAPQSPAQAQAVSMSGGQPGADSIRDKLKTVGAEVDKLPGSVDSGGRSEGRQESQLTSFADSLAAASRGARPAQELVQQVMPHGVRPGEAAWSQAVNDRVMVMASKNGQFADIQLDPPELGSLQVRLQVKNEQVTVVFNTPHGSVRDALEQNMPRLREMFADQGLNLSESSVEDHSRGNQREESGSGTSFMGYQSDSVDEGALEDVVAESLSLVDYYA